MAADNQTLARFELVGIPPAPRGVPQIEVSFEIDANGIVHVSAKDLGTGKSQSVKITAQSGLTEDEIDGIIQEAEVHREEDESKKKVADIRNRAEGLIYSTERTLEEYADALDPLDLELIHSDLEQLKEALLGSDARQVEELYKALESSAYRIAETIYAQG
jgi:molecular chaperone DnaK